MIHETPAPRPDASGGVCVNGGGAGVDGSGGGGDGIDGGDLG